MYSLRQTTYEDTKKLKINIHIYFTYNYVFTNTCFIYFFLQTQIYTHIYSMIASLKPIISSETLANIIKLDLEKFIGTCLYGNN